MKTVDVRGMQCPMPVIEAKKALKEMTEGKLVVLVDNDIAVQNLEKLALYMKLASFSEKTAVDQYKVVITAGENLGSGYQEGSEETHMEGSCQAGKIVAVSSDHMGEGDLELGKILMKGFLYALTELEQLPQTILFYNGGARLTTEGSDSLEDLRSLNEQGVEIMTCGMCLKHYGMSEKLAVGSVTNMYVIAEKMMSAVSVIKP